MGVLEGSNRNVAEDKLAASRGCEVHPVYVRPKRKGDTREGGVVLDFGVSTF